MKNTVKENRQKKKLSVKELSKILNISDVALRNIENLKSIPKINTALKISDALNVKIRDLFILKN